MEECGHKGLNCYEAGREIESLRQQLATTQAYAAQLREALWFLHNDAEKCSCEQDDEYCPVRGASRALALPQDRTALNAAIASELESMAEWFEQRSYANPHLMLRNRANELRNKP
jgi:hypothetical protein